MVRDMTGRYWGSEAMGKQEVTELNVAEMVLRPASSYIFARFLLASPSDA
jgi:hypothetical protein